MRVFKRYNPRQIARYVKILFTGTFFIRGIGLFEFHQGKIISPRVKNLKKFSVMSEVNKQIKSLSAQALA
ncbi:DUF1107 domain-containing protein [Pasteurellaceae bacterium NCTC 11878]|uniref:DUF1107 domain-containing protein n=1 Tax=Spirabiliibacterium falconis TaxID=572023 RepID=UPI001AAD0E37|nr:DUF1107 domain-containing protein [Spirabiliibacterium falconis]MBE2894901.1 DUF1107 domain-containing protein [Spirabiliibacterium falconis]